MVPEVFLEILLHERESQLWSGDNESQSGEEREKKLRLPIMQTTGSWSDLRALIGVYFYKHANQFDWFVWL